MPERRDIALANGILILAEYVNTEFHISAEHDMIYAGPDSYEEVEDHDANKLEESGWFKDEDSGRWAFYV